jgi:hypothetical protein
MSNSKKTLATDEELEKFEHFLFEMDDVLEEFVETASQAGFNLNYSVDSLADLERFITANSEHSDSSFNNRAARYLGEVFRKLVGGKWELCLKNPRYMYFKLPVISSYSTHSIEFCPIEVIANFKAKQEAGMLRTAVESHLEFKS